MQAAVHPPTGFAFTRFAATGVAAVGIAALIAAPVAPPPAVLSSPTVVRDVQLAATAVPPGGLITSFLGNQVIYCSLICPYLVQAVVTVPLALLQSPGVFVGALQSGDPLKAIGAAAATVTGTASAAGLPAIEADGTIVAPRALNALEVAVVGVLSIGPAAAGGLPGIAAAIQTARQDTFDALNRQPIAPDVPPTVDPHGVVQVVVVESMNVVGAVIFQGLNEILSGGFEAPDAVAQTLASTGDPARAVAAGVTTARLALNDARGIVADAVDTAVANIRSAIDESQTGPTSSNSVVQQESKAAALTRVKAVTPPRLTALNKMDRAKAPEKTASTKSLRARPLRAAVSTVRDHLRSAIKAPTERTHRPKASAT